MIPVLSSEARKCGSFPETVLLGCLVAKDMHCLKKHERIRNFRHGSAMHADFFFITCRFARDNVPECIVAKLNSVDMSDSVAFEGRKRAWLSPWASILFRPVQSSSTLAHQSLTSQILLTHRIVL